MFSNLSRNNNRFSTLSLLIIQPTPFCNINCDYCYLSNRLSKKTISDRILDSTFRNLFASRFLGEEFTVVWHSGEPFVMPIAFYEKAIHRIAELNTTKCKVSHSIQTNGTLINQEWCNLIREYKIKIGVSLDGPAFIHDKHRKTRSGAGTHEKTMRGIQLLQANEIDFHVITVLTEKSLNYADEMFNFFLDNRIKRVGFNIEEVEGMNTSSSLSETGIEVRYRDFIKRFYLRAKQSNNQLKIREFEGLKKLIIQGENRQVAHRQQSSPFAIISVDCDGNFSTFSPELLGMNAPDYSDFIFGNVLTDSFESTIEKENFRILSKDIQTGIDACKRECEYFALCGGGAPANKYFENRSFRSSETMFCRYTKKALIDIVLEDFENSLAI